MPNANLSGQSSSRRGDRERDVGVRAVARIWLRPSRLGEILFMLSQASTYAVSAMAYIAAMGGKSAQVKVVAEACDAPAAYLAKIINTLAHHKLVITQRGVGGGVSLANVPQEITLRDLCVALDDPIIQPRCMLGNALCTNDRDCPAHAFCTGHRQKLGEFLQQTTIADIAAFETGRRWRAGGAGRTAEAEVR